MTEKKIPTLIGLLFLITGIFVGVFFLNSKQLFRLGAEQDISPKDVRISNITESTFTISWVTQKETLGFLRWGENKSIINPALPTNSGPSFIHYVTVRNLKEDTPYHFKINSEGYDYDNNGVLWQVKTAKSIQTKNIAEVASGVVVSQKGLPVTGAIVYLTVGGSSLQSTLTQDGGKWFITISNARNQTLDKFMKIDEKNTLLEISVQAGPRGVATAQVYPISANPTPPIQLGQNHNFKTTNKGEEIIPEVPLEFGETEAGGGKIGSVTLDHPREEEVYLTSLFTISGFTTQDEALTLVIQPGNIKERLKTFANTNWSWMPNNRLKSGDYNLTISWANNQGVSDEITRDFSVKTAQ